MLVSPLSPPVLTLLLLRVLAGDPLTDEEARALVLEVVRLRRAVHEAQGA